MMLVLAMLVSSDPFARARSDIEDYCRGKPVACVTQQRRELAYFVNMMAGFSDPEHRMAATCMRSAKRTQGIDWQTAASCMRRHVKGRALGT